MEIAFVFGPQDPRKATPWGMIHSPECPKRLHGESLAGCAKVRWERADGSKYYDDCCVGIYHARELIKWHSSIQISIGS